MKSIPIILAAAAWLALPLAPCFADNSSLAETRAEAEQGDAWAQIKLGLIYHNGERVAQDDAEAVKWIRTAVEQDDALAQSILGLMYSKGIGVTKNDAEAM